MGKIASPSSDRSYDRVLRDHNGAPVWGIKNEHTPDEEIVNLRTGQSNVQYWAPEVVMNPEGCAHAFVVTSMGKREIECSRCHYATTFHPGINFHEKNGEHSVTFKSGTYPVAPPVS